MNNVGLYVLLAALGSAVSVSAAEASDEPRRVAVLVGANKAAPGRQPLRYSHRDVGAVGRVLTELGGFAADDVLQLLDPTPGEVLKALDAKLRSPTDPEPGIVVFYYSGHADAQRLYPDGRPLPLVQVRQRLEASGASVRLGIIDACRGGGWTTVKGLEPTEVFAIDPSLEISSEGTAFIASSSGLEDAHESEQLQGSFFTHHWVAALRGAGDTNEDGRVTLSESFDYAKALTIRDTALVANTPQHPSFQFNLRGRHDLPLARLTSDKTLIALEQAQGPLQLVDLSTGVIVLEIPEGRRQLRLSVPAGKYLIRRRTDAQTFAREVTVTTGKITPVSEMQLELRTASALESKGTVERVSRHTTLQSGSGQWSLSFRRHTETLFDSGFSFGNGNSYFHVGGAVGITDRLQWVFPLAFGYRLGEPGGLEVLPWAGLTSFGVIRDLDLAVSGPNVQHYRVGGGLDVRGWFNRFNTLMLSVSAGTGFEFTDGAERSHAPLTIWRIGAAIVYSHYLSSTVSLNLSTYFDVNVNRAHERLFDPEPFGRREVGDLITFGVGNLAFVGLRTLPLVQLHLNRVWTIDLGAGIVHSDALGVHGEVNGGVTWTW